MQASLWCPVLSALAWPSLLLGQVGTIAGRVGTAAGGVAEAVVVLQPAGRVVRTGVEGIFRFDSVPHGQYVVEASAVGFATVRREITLASDSLFLEFQLERAQALQELIVIGEPAGPVVIGQVETSGQFLPATKAEVVHLTWVEANLAEKIGRQIFARVPGVFVYDMDGAGNQVNISTRGLDPHRSWELNVRQDGVLLNSDLFGYPASHYSPPMEAIEQVEVVRGTAALQYGSQFGGLVNYVTKAPVAGRRVVFESSSSLGAFGLRSTYHSAGVRRGRFLAHGYASWRHSDGYRENATSRYDAQFATVSWTAPAGLVLKAQVGRSSYLHRLAGPLNDSMFAVNPRMATRHRSYYSPTIIVPALEAEWNPSPATRLLVRQSAVWGDRNSVMFIGFATTPDLPDSTGQYRPRQVDIDNFNSWTTEVRLRQAHELAGRPATLSAGLMVSINRMRRRQQGVGTRGDDYDLTVTSEGFRRDVHYRTNHAAVFAENAIALSPRWSLIPGVRVELGRTRMDGRLSYYDPADVPTRVEHRFPLFGIRTSYQFPGGAEFYSGWSQAYRPMILKDVLPENALERTDPRLRDAKGWTLEAGLRGQVGRRVGYDISGFGLRYGNRFGTVLQSDGAGGFYFFKTNVGTTMSWGLEISLDARVAEAPGFALRAFTATAVTTAKYVAGTVAVDGQNRSIRGNRVEGVPPIITRNGLTASGGRWSLGLLVSHVGRSYSDPLNTEVPPSTGARGPVPAYTVTDVNGAATLFRWARLRAGISNLFDRQYFTKRPSLYPGPGVWPSDGRGAYLALDIRFGH